MTRREWGFDLAFAVLFGAVMAAVVVAFPGSITGTLLDLGQPGALVCVGLSTVALVFRRRAPGATVVAVALISVALPGSWFGLAALYAAGVHVRPRWTLWFLAPLVVLASFVGGRGWIGFRPNDHALPVLAAGLVTLAGLYVGTRRAMLAAATERAERAEREQELLAEQARAEERTRLAAEMHDVVTHRVTLMVLQAGALGTRSDEPAVRAAAEDLRRAGGQALAELRDVVGVLRAGRTAGSATGSDGAEVPIGELETLIEEVRAAGVSVALRTQGDEGSLAPTVRRTLHRVVQEALTNARKHAPGAPVTVEVRYSTDAVTATVAHPDPAAPPGDPVSREMAAVGGGAGLDGLRQRVSMVGGALHAGPGEDGGFVMRVHLPAFVPTGPPSTMCP